MKFIKYEGEIPNVRGRNSLKRYFEGFIKSNIKTAKVDIEEDYESIASAYNALHKSAKRFGHPIKVHKRVNEIFIVRTDM